MNRIFIILFFILLTGCTTISSMLQLNTASYDGGEYEKATHLSATIKLQSSCTPSFINDLNAQSLELHLYSAAIPANTDVAKMEDDLDKVVAELVNHSRPINATYCQEKLDILDRMCSSIQHVIGNKPR